MKKCSTLHVDLRMKVNAEIVCTCRYHPRVFIIPFIINITMEINFSSKVYSKSLLKGFKEIIIYL